MGVKAVNEATGDEMERQTYFDLWDAMGWPTWKHGASAPEGYRIELTSIPHDQSPGAGYGPAFRRSGERTHG